jgi:NADH-quinone oxidoreductase subunit L
MRRMGGLWKHMPITYTVSLLGSLALIGAPLFSGFYSKDMIIEAVRASTLAPASVVYLMLLVGVFVTAFYSFRMFFLVFHGRPRWSHGGQPTGHSHHAPHESPWVVTGPLIFLAVPSVLLGGLAIGPMLFGSYFADVITVAPEHPAMAVLAGHYEGAWALALHAVETWPFWLASAGVLTAYLFYVVSPAVPQRIGEIFSGVHRLLIEKYYLDRFNEFVFAGGARRVGQTLWQRADQGVIDSFLVNGSARVVASVAGILRLGQTGFLYHYAIAMILGVALLLWWFAPMPISPSPAS